MNKTFGVIGGDRRQAELARLLAEEGRTVWTSGVAGCPDPGDLFMKMWIFIHGAACMSLTGDYDLTDQQTMQLLEPSYYAFYNETMRG